MNILLSGRDRPIILIVIDYKNIDFRSVEILSHKHTPIITIAFLLSIARSTIKKIPSFLIIYIY